MNKERAEQVALAFAAGGYVTTYEADHYLRLERGTCKKAVYAGKLPYASRPFGTKTRYLVRAKDAEALFGAHARNPTQQSISELQP